VSQGSSQGRGRLLMQHRGSAAEVSDALSECEVTSVVALTALKATSRGTIVGRHPSIRSALSTLERVARSTCTVLITGESGTGKELAVAALHDASPRAKKPLVAVNCGAIPENLIESELFGHARGAFTGAHAARPGWLAKAEGGTLFLDEVGELPLSMQVKILRVLQQKEYSPVGDSHVQRSDVRIVAATNRDLLAQVAAGRFREDLYYRLNVVHVHLPPLRERTDDIEGLARFFLRSFCDRLDRSDLVGFSPEAMATLRAYDWPGNIRTLENAVERAVLLSDGPMVLVEDLPPTVSGAGRLSQPPPAVTELPLPDTGIDLRGAIQEYENNMIRQALDRTKGNRNRAAQLLGLNRTTLVEMLKRKGL